MPALLSQFPSSSEMREQRGKDRGRHPWHPSARLVADRLDVVAIGVEHERSVVVGVVDLAHPRPPLSVAAGRERGGVEGIDHLPVLGGERDVHPRLRAPGRACRSRRTGSRRRNRPSPAPAPSAASPRAERALLVEGLALLVVDYVQSYVVDPHGASSIRRGCMTAPRYRPRSSRRNRVGDHEQARRRRGGRRPGGPLGRA